MIFKPLILILACVTYLIPLSAFSKCTKEDIEFYLDKGFNQEQITQLCAPSEAPVPKYEPYQQQVIIYREEETQVKKDGLSREELDAVKTLQTGGDVTGLHVTAQAINYTTNVCNKSINPPHVKDRYKACPEIDFLIQRKNLQVSSSGKKLLVFGTATVQIEGEIDRKAARDFDSYSATEQKQLKRYLNWKKEGGNRTEFPVRGDFSVTQIVSAFRTLAATYEERENTDQVAEVEKETKEAVKKSKKAKKKRWWNPFD